MVRKKNALGTMAHSFAADAQPHQYCRHVLELAWNSPNPDMRQISDKLAHLYFDPDGLFNRFVQKPLMERLLAKKAPAAHANSDIMPPPSAAPSPAPDTEAENDRTYVGRLR